MDTLRAMLIPPGQSSGTAVHKKDDTGEVSASAAAIVPATVTVIPTPTSEPGDSDNKQQISNAVKDINSFFQNTQRSIGFSLDETSGNMVMQIKDIKTNEVIRQIPGEDALKLAKQLDDLTGILFKARA